MKNVSKIFIKKVLNCISYICCFISCIITCVILIKTSIDVKTKIIFVLISLLLTNLGLILNFIKEEINITRVKVIFSDDIDDTKKIMPENDQNEPKDFNESDYEDLFI